jgi:NAD(P)H-dependent FMN reductase
MHASPPDRHRQHPAGTPRRGRRRLVRRTGPRARRLRRRGRRPGEIDLPLLNEPNDDARDDYVHEHTQRWSATVAAADAVVFVMPEYNRTFTAPLKNALDYLYYEWNYKPVGLVSYGGVSGGLRAAYAIKPALVALRMVPIDDGVTISRVRRHIVDGRLQADQMHAESAAEMLDELAKLSVALAPLRPELTTSASGGS